MLFAASNISSYFWTTPTSQAVQIESDFPLLNRENSLEKKVKVLSHIKKVINDLEKLKKSGLLEQFKKLQNTLRDQDSAQAANASEMSTPNDAEIYIHNFFMKMDMLLEFLSDSLSQEIEGLQNNNFVETISDATLIKTINWIEHDIEKVLDKVQQSITDSDNHYEHPPLLKNRWIAWLIGVAAVFINTIMTYLYGIHLVDIPSVVLCTFSAALTLLPRGFQERINLHDLIGAHKKQEHKTAKQKLTELKIQLTSISTDLHSAKKYIRRYLRYSLRKLQQNPSPLAGLRQNNVREIDLMIALSLCRSDSQRGTSSYATLSGSFTCTHRQYA